MRLTKRRIATPSWKTRTRLPKISRSHLRRLLLQLRGNVTQCNGLSVGQNRKLGRRDYIFCQAARQLLPRKGKEPDQSGSERLLLLPFRTSLGNRSAPLPKPRTPPCPGAPRPRGAGTGLAGGAAATPPPPPRLKPTPPPPPPRFPRKLAGKALPRANCVTCAASGFGRREGPRVRSAGRGEAGSPGRPLIAPARAAVWGARSPAG